MAGGGFPPPPAIDPKEPELTCARGCCDTQAEHYRSLGVLNPARKSLTKVTTDDHGTHTVDVTEHWHERQDVHVKGLETVRAKIGPQS